MSLAPVPMRKRRSRAVPGLGKRLFLYCSLGSLRPRRFPLPSLSPVLPKF